ncbi:MAG: CpaF family protein, partial [Chloroflexaceae bacterium]
MHPDDFDDEMPLPSRETPDCDPRMVSAVAGVLRSLVRSGRLRDCWHLPPEEVFDLVGAGGELLEHEWVHVDWYGPLELWRDPEHEVSDILYNGPPGDPFFVVQRGAMLNTGVTAHPQWIAWTQRQLLLRSFRLQPYEDWPAPMMQGVADGLRFAITRPPLSRDGGSLAIRLLPERWRTLDDLVQAGMLTRDASNLLLEALA